MNVCWQKKRRKRTKIKILCRVLLLLKNFFMFSFCIFCAFFLRKRCHCPHFVCLFHFSAVSYSNLCLLDAVFGFKCNNWSLLLLELDTKCLAKSLHYVKSLCYQKFLCKHLRKVVNLIWFLLLSEEGMVDQSFKIFLS